MMPYGAKPVELKEPYHGHVSHQLMRAIPTRLSDTNTDFERAAHGSIALYSGLDPRDPHESILDRLAVAGLNAAMEANAKSVNSSKDAWVSEKYTRIFCQNSAAVVKLLEARDKHRARQTQTVNVRDVNVHPGAQAIVGNVTKTDGKKNDPASKGLPNGEGDKGSEE
ncbi:hypothetical protein AUC71_07380 [Methyloceanibacter marginalis]|uniref:Uncharacterized protein n=1 Tax=Methyloceanibacter marginalis TaxID=1774971 RepID=A0A1E3WDF6_9HYPH|nr:hypothetical protein [Methyloceanibacter marginalis]ODS03855.1 hypothetical protein AUC71_07380 [Methyloceanibacter marginalis]